MRLHRSQPAFLLAAITVAFLSAEPAAAEPYPAEAPPATVSSATVSDNGAVTFSGTGFIPGEDVEIRVHYRSSGTAAGVGTAADTSTRLVTVGYATKSAVTDSVVTAHAVPAALPIPQAVITTVTADGTGSFSTRVVLTQVGVAVLEAEGAISHHIVSATVRVLARRASGSGLAVTGESGTRLAGEVGGAILAILIGTGLVWAAARRRRRVDA